LDNLHDLFFFFQAEDGIRDFHVTGVQTCALPICPAVEKVIDLPEIASPAGWRRMSAARVVSLKLSSGSPIPMKTTPRTGRSASARTCCTCSMISHDWRLRLKPSFPVMQKSHASAQPTWLETQRTYFSSKI